MSMSMSKAALLAQCKKEGFVRYSHLNKRELVDLINGREERSKPKRQLREVVADGKGISVGDLFTEIDEHSKWSFEVDDWSGEGFMVRGINLEGLFNAKFIPDRIEQYETYRDYDTDESEPDDPEMVVAQRKIRGGWLVPRKYKQEFDALIAAQKLATTPWHQPLSLYELAAREIIRKKLDVHLPKSVKKDLRELVKSLK